MRVLMAFMLFGLLPPAQATVAAGGSETVERFVEAFNQHDVDKMLDVAAEEIRWMSVAGDQLSVETSTPVQLRDAMADYFTSTPGARAEIRSISESGRFVHTVEEMFWKSNGTEKSQCSMVVYELAGEKVQNVWYFPAHECP